MNTDTQTRRRTTQRGLQQQPNQNEPRMEHRGNAEFKTKSLNRSKQRKQRRMPNLCFLCYLLLRIKLTADYADTRPGAPGFTSFVFIRAYPRNPRFLFVIPQIDILRGAQRNRRLVITKNG